MKKVVKKSVAKKVVSPVVKKTVAKKVVAKKVKEVEVPEVDEVELNSLYNEIVFAASGLGEESEEYIAVIDTSTSLLVDKDLDGLQSILESVQDELKERSEKPENKVEEIKETGKKKPVAKKIVKKVAKKEVITPTTEEKIEEPKVEKPIKKEAPKTVDTKKSKVEIEELKEFDGLKIGNKINHPKNGTGEITGFWKDKTKELFHPKVKFEDGKLSIISFFVAKRCKMK